MTAFFDWIIILSTRHDVGRLRTGLYLGELSRIEVKRGSTGSLWDDWDLKKVKKPSQNIKK
jgi:hypothetical protein